ncbi:MAG: hypothetical protein ACKOJC_09280 [Actinomycetota bacterium]
MNSTASLAEYFSIAGDRQRLLVSTNSRETRENWFKAYPADEEQALRRSIPAIPPMPDMPGSEIDMTRKAPQIPMWIFLLSANIGVLGALQEGLLVLNAIPAVLLVWMIVTRQRLQPYTFPWSPLSFFCTVALIVFLVGGGVLAIVDSDRSVDVGIIQAAVFVFAILVVFMQWVIEWLSVKQHNQRVESQRRLYETGCRAREAAFRLKKEIEDQIAKMSVPCLHYDEMARLRSELLQEALRRAFAELGVSPETQATVMRDRERLVLESSGPTFGRGSIASEYERPIVEFPFALKKFSTSETPAMAYYLSHLYEVRVAVVLPEGFGIVTLMIDSVDLTVSTRDLELLLWRSISRVARLNADEIGDADVISVQSYGGSESVIAVNGIFVNENIELIPVVPLSAGEWTGDQTGGSARQVSAFVLSIQNRMTEFRG